MIEKKDERVKGIVYALVSTNQGTEVTDFKTLQRGDLMEYWFPDGGGHAVIIDDVWPDGNKWMMRVYGSNYGTHGIDYMVMPLLINGRLQGGLKAAYAVRPIRKNAETKSSK